MRDRPPRRGARRPRASPPVAAGCAASRRASPPAATAPATTTARARWASGQPRRRRRLLRRRDAIAPPRHGLFAQEDLARRVPRAHRREDRRAIDGGVAALEEDVAEIRRAELEPNAEGEQRPRLCHQTGREAAD